MWGNLELIKLYPRNWQSSMYRSMHPWLLHTTIWHYWLLFTFTIALNLFFIYVYKALTYQRAEIRGTRSTGEKRRLAWPEMLIVIVPFYWAINIVINALSYLRVVEGSCGHVLLSVQVNGFQWGWKYCYSDTFYIKIYSNPIKVGVESTASYSGSIEKLNRNVLYDMTYRTVKKEKTYIYEIEKILYERTRSVDDIEATERLRWDFDIFDKVNTEANQENYWCRFWLKNFGGIEDELNNKTNNKKWQDGYWINSQGIEPNTLFCEEMIEKDDELVYNSIKDPLRLLRASGALILPTRNTVRLMACSDDITHSWAVPALGIKMDCVPGRIFCIYLNIIREGIYFGQCSELCGWNHYNMPIIVYGLSLEHFITWWEVELHTLFRKKYYDYDINIDINDADYITYEIIDHKFK